MDRGQVLLCVCKPRKLLHCLITCLYVLTSRDLCLTCLRRTAAQLVPLYLGYLTKDNLLVVPAAGVHSSMDDSQLRAWVLQAAVWSTSPPADEHCLLPAQHPTAGPLQLL